MLIRLLLSIFILLPLISYGKDCSRPTEAKCTFYTECLEDRFNCQSTEFQYPVEYGDRFCDGFQNIQEELSDKGKLWVDRTMVCLQTALFDNFIARTTSRESNQCKSISEVAFNSHHRCYVRPTGTLKEGICPLWTDYHIIFKTGRPWESIGTQYSKAVRKQVVQTARTCMGYWFSFKRKKSFRRNIPVDSILEQLNNFITTQ